jgi:CheY-like chemotaxis protein
MNKKKILIIDDDAAIVDSLQIILENEGYETNNTVNIEAILSMKKDLPDLILLDFSLLAMDGWDICSILKSQEPTKHIPIIMVSADKDIAKIAKAARADAYIPKPFEISNLLKKVKENIK